MIIIGNKPYKNINISEIIDQFNFNIRFNFGLPGDNNGTKTYMQIVNLHVDINLKKNNLDIPLYKHIDKNYKNEIKKQLNPDNYPFGIILMEHYRKKIYNIFLKNNNCPYTISTLPRMGIHGVMTSVIDNKRPFVTHFSFNKEDNKIHSYNNIDNHKQGSICHNPNEEFNILKWLHDNDKIDATLCLLLDTQIPTLECSFIKPKFESIILLLEKFGICVLNNYYEINIINDITKEFNNIFINHKDLIEILDKEECSNDERIFHAEKYGTHIKQFSNEVLFNLIAKKYNRNLNKKTLINKLVYEDGKVKNSGAGWHRDNHNCQFKTIMYLTDVDNKNGNFQFLTNSSKKYLGYPKPRTPSYNTRFSDETIKDLLNTKKTELHDIVGNKGTIILVDTTYIHRGNIIQYGERKAITQYFF